MIKKRFAHPSRKPFFFVGPGGDLLDGHIYFASGSHLYSYRVSGTE